MAQEFLGKYKDLFQDLDKSGVRANSKNKIILPKIDTKLDYLWNKIENQTQQENSSGIFQQERRVKTRKLEPLKQVPTYLNSILKRIDIDDNFNKKDLIFDLKNENGFVTKMDAEKRR